MVDINLFFITLQSERLAEPHNRFQRGRLMTTWQPCTDVPNRYGTLFANQQIESLKTKSVPNRYGTLFANQQIESLKTKSLKATRHKA